MLSVLILICGNKRLGSVLLCKVAAALLLSVQLLGFGSGGEPAARGSCLQHNKPIKQQEEKEKYLNI